jgi:hypothetical protein
VNHDALADGVRRAQRSEQVDRGDGSVRQSLRARSGTGGEDHDIRLELAQLLLRRLGRLHVDQ